MFSDTNADLCRSLTLQVNELFVTNKPVGGLAVRGTNLGRKTLSTT